MHSVTNTELCRMYKKTTMFSSNLKPVLINRSNFQSIQRHVFISVVVEVSSKELKCLLNELEMLL